MRNRYFLLFDILGLLAVPFVVLAVRFEGFDWSPGFLRTVIAFTAVSLPVRIWVAWANGLYSCLWRHASIVELERILLAGAIATVLNFVIGAWILPYAGVVPFRMPYIALVLDGLLSLIVLALPRLMVRYVSARRYRDLGGTRTLVVGAGSAGQLIAREASASARALYTVVGFVDDDKRKQGLLLHGIRVEGRIDDLPRLIRDLAAREVVIAMPSARGSLVRRIVEMCAQAGVRTRTVPDLADIISGRVGITSIRPVEIQDLLRRSPITTDLSAVKKLATGRVALVTGAGGSIGSELCRQIADLEPELLVLVDHSENQIFEIERELRRRSPLVKLAPVIADIRDLNRMREVFGRFRPFAVFHAAAHKHVPLMEENVVEAVTNNVLGTRNVVDTSIEHGVTHFVLISTDKAVRPTSIMGATKRIAEIIVRLAAAREKKHFVAVRFGNVLGSRGSVVPSFMQQIARGGPVTVTHPEMRRFFMTIPESVQLVLQAGALGTGGELFVLDMGEPVRIADLARDLIRLSGLEEGVDIEIKYTGIRAGEKLYEEVLFGDEDVQETEHPKVIRAVAELPSEALDKPIGELIRLASIAPNDVARLRASIIDLVPDFIPADAKPKDVLPIEGRRNTGESRIVS
jgi:FlaA1/EpsC-like NDP-sugar epimerase